MPLVSSKMTTMSVQTVASFCSSLSTFENELTTDFQSLYSTIQKLSPFTCDCIETKDQLRLNCETTYEDYLQMYLYQERIEFDLSEDYTLKYMIPSQISWCEAEYDGDDSEVEDGHCEYYNFCPGATVEESSISTSNDDEFFSLSSTSTSNNPHLEISPAYQLPQRQFCSCGTNQPASCSSCKICPGGQSKQQVVEMNCTGYTENNRYDYYSTCEGSYDGGMAMALQSLPILIVKKGNTVSSPQSAVSSPHPTSAPTPTPEPTTQPTTQTTTPPTTVLEPFPTPAPSTASPTITAQPSYMFEKYENVGYNSNVGILVSCLVTVLLLIAICGYQQGVRLPRSFRRCLRHCRKKRSNARRSSHSKQKSASGEDTHSQDEDESSYSSYSDDDDEDHDEDLEVESIYSNNNNTYSGIIIEGKPSERK